jgi:hypothetical protein
MKKRIRILLKIITFIVVVGVGFLIFKPYADERTAAMDVLWDLRKEIGIENYLVQSKIFRLTAALFLDSAGTCLFLIWYAVDIFFKYDKEKRKKNLAALAAMAVVFAAIITVMFLNREEPFVYEFGDPFFSPIYILFVDLLYWSLNSKINPKKNTTGDGEKDGKTLSSGNSKSDGEKDVREISNINSKTDIKKEDTITKTEAIKDEAISNEKNTEIIKDGEPTEIPNG